MTRLHAMPMSSHRYHSMPYRNCGRSGLKLPAVSLGLWHGFAGYSSDAVSHDLIHTAFDHGVTHFDLANNYGGHPGASETLFGKFLKDLPRDELVITSKAGFPMWPGPYGDGSSKKSIIASCDQSLKRLGVEYVDIFYSHRHDPETPLEETMEALETIIRQGKALYAGLSNYPDPIFGRAVQSSRSASRSPIIVNQAFYSMLDRAAEQHVIPTAEAEGIGVVVYSPHVQGLLTDRYLEGIPPDSRIAMNACNGAIRAEWITPQLRLALNLLNDVARCRGQTLAQMSLAWLLNRTCVTSVLIGASKTHQIVDCVGCLDNLHFTVGELERIDSILSMPRR